MAKPVGRRQHGAGSIQWLTPSKARLRVYVVDDEGKRRQRTKVVSVSHKNHGGRGEAQDALDDFADELGRPMVPAGRTVKDLMKEYVAQCRRTGKAKSTVESYDQVKGRLGDLGSIAVSALTAHDLDLFYGTLELAPNTIRHTHAVLSAALEQAIAWGDWGIEVNPARRASPPRRKVAQGGPLAPSDVARMIELALRSKDEGGDEDTVLAVAIILSTITGARRGELAGFRWDDIDAKTQTIRIERQWVAGKGGQTLSEPKSAIGKRVMSIGPEGLAVLERYKVTMTEVLGAEPEGWLLSPDGGRSPMRAKALGDQVTNLAGRLGLKVTTHSFRKVSSTQLVASGVDVDTAARRMGHTKEVMLAHYVLGSDDRAVAAATTLEARLIDQGLPLSEFLA